MVPGGGGLNLDVRNRLPGVQDLAERGFDVRRQLRDHLLDRPADVVVDGRVVDVGEQLVDPHVT